MSPSSLTSTFTPDEIFHRGIASLVLLLFMVALRQFMLRYTDINALSPSEKRKLLVNSRNMFICVYLVLFLLVWGSALKDAAVALAGIMVAFVIATKEWISCLMGSGMILFGRYYSIGDRIHLLDYYGDVTDQTLLSTTIMEVGEGSQYTGRFLTFPNNLLLEHPVRNEAQCDYTFGFVPVFLMPGDDAPAARKLLLDLAESTCAGYLEDAKLAMAQVPRWLHMPTFDPQVTLRMDNAESISLQLRLPVVCNQRYETEQAILQQFLERFAFAARETAGR